MSRTPLARIALAALAAVLSAGTLAAPALAAPAAAAVTSGTIQGTYTTDAGAPVVGASVYVYTADDQDWVADTTTDDNGAFTLPDVAAGDVKVQFAASGIEQWAHRQLDFDSATRLTVVAGQTLTLDERQLPTGTIAGQLTELNGDPAAWVSIQAIGQGERWSTGFGLAGEDGRYSLDVLPGDYKVSFSRDSAMQYAYGAIAADDATTFTVAAGKTVQVDDKLLATGTLGGHLTTAAGAPLATTVTLHRGDDWINSTSTDDNGDYRFTGVLPGGYQVSFGADSAEQWVPGTLRQSEARTFPVTAGRNTVVDDSLQAGGTVHGRLIDGDGNGLSGYSVSAILDDESTYIHYDGVTDEDGRWSLSDVFAGSYLVAFGNPDGTRYQYSHGKGTSADADRIPVGSGADVTVDETWLPAASLTVTLTDAKTGAALSDFCVYLDTPQGQRACAEGTRLTMTGLPGGTFSLSTDVGPGSFYIDRWDVKATVVAGQTTTLDVPMALGGKVSTTVTDRATGRPVPNACIDLRTLGTGGLGDGGGSACGDDRGVVTTPPVAQDSYEMFAYAPGGEGPQVYGHQWVGRSGGTGDQREAARIAIQPGKLVAGPAVRLDPAGTIAGTVTGADGKPAGNSFVAYSAYDFGAGPTHGVGTDDQGRYTLSELGPYSWPLLIDSGQLRQWSGGVGNRFQAKTVKVRSGKTTTYDPRMKAGATIKGKVTLADGVDPASGWRLTAYNAVTGDEIGLADSYGTVGGAYEMRLPGDQQVKIGWYVNGQRYFHQGWYDHASGLATAKKVSVPASGTKKLNLTID
jgi:5-hydroxyisourate hydrolase-like protein (transthyretin family)